MNLEGLTPFHADGTPIDPSELPSSLPAYLIDVTPELRIDGEVVATGTTVVMGTQEDLTLTFSAPNKSKERVKHLLVAGEYYGIAIDPGVISEEQMQAIQAKIETTKAKLEAQDFTGLTKEEILGALLHTTAISYFVELTVLNRFLAKKLNVVNLRLPSEATFIFKLHTYSVFGVPLRIFPSGLVMDVGRNISARKALNGENEKTLQFSLAAGQNSSALEHSVPEQFLSTPDSTAEGVSAVKALKIANNQGIPIYTINQSNINSVLPQLQVESDVIIDIQNAISTGKEVVVSRTNITYAGWTGTGFIIIDPNTGDGAYMISGGLNGAQILAIIAVHFFILTIILAVSSITLGGPAGIAAAAVALGFFAIAMTALYYEIAYLAGKEKADEFFWCLLEILGFHFAGEGVIYALGKIGQIFFGGILAIASIASGAISFTQCMEGLLNTE